MLLLCMTVLRCQEINQHGFEVRAALKREPVLQTLSAVCGLEITNRIMAVRMLCDCYVYVVIRLPVPLQPCLLPLRGKPACLTSPDPDKARKSQNKQSRTPPIRERPSQPLLPAKCLLCRGFRERRVQTLLGV